MRHLPLALGIVALVGCTAQSSAQYLDPQATMDQMIRRQLSEQAERDARNRQQEAERFYYQRLSPAELMGQLQRYCPRLNPPCDYVPPQDLLNEAIRRGLIQPAAAASRRPGDGTDCVALGDGLGGGISNCQ